MQNWHYFASNKIHYTFHEYTNIIRAIFINLAHLISRNDDVNKCYCWVHNHLKQKKNVIQPSSSESVNHLFYSTAGVAVDDDADNDDDNVLLL